MSNNLVKQSNKIPTEINKRTSPQKSIIDGGSGTTEYSLDDQTPSSKKLICSTGKIKIKKGLSSKHSASEAFDTDNKSYFCEKCGVLKDSVIKTLSSLKQYVESINEKINIIYHKTNKNRKTSNDLFSSNDYYMFYSDIDKMKCGTILSNQLRGLMKSIKILSDKYDYILNKQGYYENIVTMFREVKVSNKDDDFSKINKDISLLENNNKELYEMPELFKKYNASKEAAEKLLKELKGSMSDSSVKNEDKTMINEMEINLDFHDQFKENHAKNEIFRLQKENISLRMELSLIYEQMREDNKIYEMKESMNCRRSSKDFNPEKKKKSSRDLQSANNFNSAVASQGGTNHNQQTANPNSALFIKLKNENTEEIYVNYKNFINRLKMSEFL